MVQLATEPGSVLVKTLKKLNLGAGKVPMENAVNADRQPLPGIDVVTDLFVFPWPFADGEFDEVHASHLIEHVPHQVRRDTWKLKEYPCFYCGAAIINDEQELQRLWRCIACGQMQPRYQPEWNEDGFFVFMREIHRILKPGGICVLVGPYAKSTGADQDPTHVRSINETTFSYLWQESPTFDYGLGFTMQQEEFALFAYEDMTHLTPAEQQSMQRLNWDVFHSFRCVLRRPGGVA